MKIRELMENEHPPMDLLLLADPSREKVERYLREGECRVAEVSGEVIGVYVLVKTGAGRVELMNVAVKESEHGKGIGKKLILDAIDRAREAGLHTIEVGTGNSSIGQLALYQKCGFRIVGVEQDFFVKHYDEEIYENGIQCRDMVRLALEVQ
ncbi:GNAT family N-acetyltransferase [Alteribacter keqinensis]|uniref:GNAT family N-acetyltransferase n=1 Tax=Alteribacter keqinensis TaxID=2483800 RepID=A0A3M7TQG8_9BACI|nr:GNAT family N-acetyltransferase [Alteribacter keqinensis]RNA66600.1 GNAT family N-acetyltransferase [Alteribacter keqinensis]